MTRMPQVTASQLVKFLKAQGFVEIRQSGSHLTLWHSERQAVVTVPMHTRAEMGRGLGVRILKDAGFSVEDYIKLR